MSGQRGSALLAVLLIAFALAAMSALAGRAGRQVAAELRTRAEVLCARYAAIGGLALGPTDGDAASVVDDRVASLEVTLVSRSPEWCVVRSSAVCGRAQRTLERTVEPGRCGGSAHHAAADP